MLSEYMTFPNRFAVIMHLLNPPLHLLKIKDRVAKGLCQRHLPFNTALTLENKYFTKGLGFSKGAVKDSKGAHSNLGF